MYIYIHIYIHVYARPISKSRSHNAFLKVRWKKSLIISNSILLKTFNEPGLWAFDILMELRDLLESANASLKEAQTAHFANISSFSERNPKILCDGINNNKTTRPFSLPCLISCFLGFFVFVFFDKIMTWRMWHSSRPPSHLHVLLFWITFNWSAFKIWEWWSLEQSNPSAHLDVIPVFITTVLASY